MPRVEHAKLERIDFAGECADGDFDFGCVGVGFAGDRVR